MPQPLVSILVLILSLLVQPLTSAAEEAEKLAWDAMMPSDFQVEGLFEKYKVEEMEDNDPRAAEFMKELKSTWKAAPVVESLAGRLVKLPGFVVPLDTQDNKVKSFFLVPYFGACIHVPPPPANQMVYVTLAKGQELAADSLYAAIWATGRLGIQHTSNDLGDAGYSMEAATIEEYKEEDE
jgi:hypothetical protein